MPLLDLNEEPKNPLELDLNAPADMQEMVIDPVKDDPRQHEMFLELNDLLNQVNEEEEDAQAEENLPEPVLAGDGNLFNLANMEIAMPAHFEPLMPLEIQEDDLMNDEEIQQQIQEEGAPTKTSLGPKISKWALCLLIVLLPGQFPALWFQALLKFLLAHGPNTLHPE